jgi:inward rectifier potassium channel
MSRLKGLQRKFQFNKDTGFGAGSNNQGDRLLNRDGTFNVKRTGLSILERINPFHQLIMMSWPKFNTMILLVFVSLNLLFTGIYYCIGLEELVGTTHSDPFSKFIEVFSFSAQTLTTVGYGRVSPVGNLASLMASFEALLGLSGFALVTGLLYGRFSRPNAKLLSSENAIIAPYQDKTALMFRIANGRSNQLIECEAIVLFNYVEKEKGERKFISLDLELPKVTALSLSWTIVHPIDEKSPLYGLNKEEIIDMNAEIILMFKAFDDTYSQAIHTRLSYTANELVYGAKFLPMYKRSENGYATLLELNKIGQYQLVTLPDFKPLESI